MSPLEELSIEKELDEEFASVPPGKHVLSYTNETGDTKVIWDASNADEVSAARDTYNKLKKKGFYAYKATGKEGVTGELIREFDPSIERMIMTQEQVGG